MGNIVSEELLRKMKIENIKNTSFENSQKNIEDVMKEYIDEELHNLRQIRLLYRKIKLPAFLFAYSFGGLGTSLLVVGLCISLKLFLGNIFWLGILLSVLGIVMVSCNYPIYQKILSKRKQKYSAQMSEITNVMEASRFQ